MPVCSIPKILLQPELKQAIQATFYYRYYLDTAWILIGDGTINTDGTVTASPSITFNIDFNKIYTIRADNEQCETMYTEDIFVPCEQGCPDGFTLSMDGTYCYKIDTQPAEQTGSGTLAVEHYQLNVYQTFGVVFYKPGFNEDGTWPTGDASKWPTIYSPNSPATYPFANTVSYTSGIWINQTSCTNDDGSCGRLNALGIWLQGNQTYTGTLGFSRQINVATSGWYFIGVGADNYANIRINGTLILHQDVAAISGSNYLNSGSQDVLFKFLNVYPVYLNAGINLVEMTATNVGSQGILGFEIYSGSEATLIALGSTSVLEPYIIFSTKDIVNGDLFDVGNYNCNAYAGYTLINEGSPSGWVCQKITTTNTNCE